MTKHDRSIPLSQRAYEIIKRNIITLKLAPGAVIDEAELQDELGLGRTPIREALKRLALENLVTIVPRRGIFVTEIGINDLQRLLEVRVVLEKQAARLAAQRGTPAHWQRMESLLGDVIANDAASDEEIIHTDESFHEIIYEAADNHFLRDTLKVLLSLNERLWYFFLSDLKNIDEAVDDHRGILHCLKQRDGDQAATLMEQHIHGLQEKMQAIIFGGSQEES